VLLCLQEAVAVAAPATRRERCRRSRDRFGPSAASSRAIALATIHRFRPASAGTGQTSASIIRRRRRRPSQRRRTTASPTAAPDDRSSGRGVIRGADARRSLLSDTGRPRVGTQLSPHGSFGGGAEARLLTRRTHAIKSPARGWLLLRPLEPEAAGASRGRFVAVPCRPLRACRRGATWLSQRPARATLARTVATGAVITI
jgi:hypothetical protein